MLELGWFYGDPRLSVMNTARWLVFYRAIQEREKERLQWQSSLLKQMLGLEAGDAVVPLSAFVNPEMFQKLQSIQFGGTAGTEIDEDDTIWIIEEMNKEEHANR